MLRCFPTFQVATTCFSCSPPDLNSVVTDFMFCLHVKQPLPSGNNPISVNNNNNYYYYYYCYYKTNLHIAKELEITPGLDKLLEYKRNWIQHVNRMTRDRIPRIMKHYSPTGRRNRGRPLKRLLDT